MGRLEELRAKSAKAVAKRQETIINPTNKQARAQMVAASTTAWTVGDLLKYEEKVWRVGFVSDNRMRLDPVTPNKHQIHDNVISSYGGSVNVSPNSVLPRVAEGELDSELLRRVTKLTERPTDTPERVVPKQEAAKSMAVTVAVGGGEKKAVATKAVAAPKTGPVPVEAPVSDVKKANKERLERLKAGKAAKPPVAGAVAKVAKPKKEKSRQPCKCGCGEEVTGSFAQGHDARFKSWLLKVERGQMAVKELPKSVQAGYEWKKKGDGYIPTKNYKGEAHKGYDAAGA